MMATRWKAGICIAPAFASTAPVRPRSSCPRDQQPPGAGCTLPGAYGTSRHVRKSAHGPRTPPFERAGRWGGESAEFCGSWAPFLGRASESRLRCGKRSVYHRTLHFAARRDVHDAPPREPCRSVRPTPARLAIVTPAAVTQDCITGVTLRERLPPSDTISPERPRAASPLWDRRRPRRPLRAATLRSRAFASVRDGGASRRGHRR